MTIRNNLLSTSRMFFAPEGATITPRNKRSGGRRDKGATPQVVSVFYRMTNEDDAADAGDYVALPEGATVSEIADAYGARVSDEKEYDLELDDEQIHAIVVAIPGDGMDKFPDDPSLTIDEARLEKLMERDEIVAGKEALADLSSAENKTPTRALMVRLAAQVSPDADKIVHEAYVGEQKRDGAPIPLAFQLCKDLEGTFDPESGAIVSCPAVDAMPIPMTSEKNKPAGYNRSLDKYPIGDTTRKGNSVRDFADEIGEGPEILKVIRELVEMDKAETDRSVTIRDAIKNMDKDARKALAGKMSKTRNTRTRTFGKAIAVLQVLNQLEDGFESKHLKFTWTFAFNDGAKNLDEIATLNKPFMFLVPSRHSGGREGPFSISQFISLQQQDKKKGMTRLAFIRQRGGKLADLKAAFTRGTKGKSDATIPAADGKLGAGVAKIETAEQFEGTVYAILGAFDKQDQTRRDKMIAKVRGLLDTADNAAERMKRLLAVFNANDVLDTILAPYINEIAEYRTQQAKLRKDEEHKAKQEGGVQKDAA